MLACARADTRQAIARLGEFGQAPLDGLAERVADPLDGRQIRSEWILANWPQVIESVEADHALASVAWRLYS